MNRKWTSPLVSQPAIAALAALAVIAMPLLCLALSPQASSSTAPPPLPTGPGKIIMEHSCAGCHSLSVVTTNRATPAQWDAVVRLMVSRGAALTDQDMPTLTQYLAKSFAPDAPQYALPVEAASAPAAMPSTATPPTNAAATVAPSTTDQSASTIHVNVNHASVRQLETALSLTRDEARTLIAYRKQHGDFQNWQQVGEVPGVPAGKIIEYQDRIAF